MVEHAHAMCADLFLVVARAPVPGFTKTRLGKAIGMERASELYLAFLQDVAATFFANGSLPAGITRGWAFTPDSFDFGALVATFPGQTNHADPLFIPQEGDSLGDRLTNLLHWAVDRGFERAVIMATDSPQLDASVATDSLAALHDRDLVIGRTLDGGYYLVGARGFTDILTRVPMSTADAAQALADLATEDGLSVAELGRDFDVDTSADLELLIECLRLDARRAPATHAALRHLGFLP